jgi:hypothetical protein
MKPCLTYRPLFKPSRSAGQAARIYNKFEVLCTAGSIFTGQLKADFSVNSAKICQKEVANQLAVWHIGGMTDQENVGLNERIKGAKSLAELASLKQIGKNQRYVEPRTLRRRVKLIKAAEVRLGKKVPA